MAQDDNDQGQGGEQAEGGALDLQSTLDYALELVQDQARIHPFRTLGIAAGVGYVLGGGVPKFLVRLGLLAAGRIMTDAVATEGFRSIATIGGLGGEASETQGAPQERAKNGHHRKRGNGDRQARRE